MGGSQATELPERHAPIFSGTDQHGSTFDVKSMEGRPWIASFFFTSCSDVCPALNTVVAQLQKDYGHAVRFVSISTDPETDTVEELKKYAAQYGAKDGVWWMIRMPFDSMRTVASKGFGLIDPQEPAMHSTRFVAIDSHMKISGYYDSAEPKDMDNLRSWINSQL